MQKGNLYLIPTTLGECEHENVLPSYNALIFRDIDVFIVEELRSARRFLRKAGYKKDFEQVIFHLLNEHTPENEVSCMLEEAFKGKNIGLLSEAGLPCVADPGNIAVRIAHRKQIKIIPLVGPSSIMLSLMASGFNGQNFAFNGYIPVKDPDKTKKIKELENLVLKYQQTQIFIEAPYRNISLFESIIKTCHPETMLCIATDLTMDTEYIASKKIVEWKKQTPDINKRPTVFLLGAMY